MVLVSSTDLAPLLDSLATARIRGGLIYAEASVRCPAKPVDRRGSSPSGDAAGLLVGYADCPCPPRSSKVSHAPEAQCGSSPLRAGRYARGPHGERPTVPLPRSLATGRYRGPPRFPRPGRRNSAWEYLRLSVR